MERNEKTYGKVLFSQEQVNKRIKEIALEIVQSHETSPLFVCLMRGGAPFAAQLMCDIAEQKPDFHPELDYMTVSTYGNKRESDRPRVVMDVDPRTEVEGREVIIIDDVFDEGHTVDFARKHMYGLGASEVKAAVLGDKQKELPPGKNRPEIVGFEFPNVWLTGMGMDDAGLAPEANRWMGVIATCK